jgi:aspartate ammonia-lyase
MSKNLAQHCDLIEAVPQKCLEFLNKSTVIITAFLPLTGYDKAEDLLQEFSESGEKDFRKFLEEKLGAEVVNKTLSPHNIVSLGYRD